MDNKFIYNTKFGDIAICENGKAITEIKFTIEKSNDCNLKETKLTAEAYRQLTEFFEGCRKEFELPLEPKGTEFQKKVWKALSEIPYGELRTYKDIAKAVENEKAVRAVGGANNRNPIQIVFPCHRVVGSNGKLVGYAAGLDVKKALLEIESKNEMK